VVSSRSNSFKFWNFELWISITNVKFDFFDRFVQIQTQIWSNSSILGQLFAIGRVECSFQYFDYIKEAFLVSENCFLVWFSIRNFRSTQEWIQLQNSVESNLEFELNFFGRISNYFQSTSKFVRAYLGPKVVRGQYVALLPGHLNNNELIRAVLGQWEP